jgi:DNA-binding NarL/FixJ family response regulator
LVVERDRLVGEVLASALATKGLVVVGEVFTGVEALVAARAMRPDVVLLSLGLADADPIHVGADILAASPGTRLIATSGTASSTTVRALRRAGFEGFLSTSASLASIAETVRNRPSETSPSWSVPRRVTPAPTSDLDGLTGREREVLQLLAQGRSATWIADRLGISQSTARTHIHHVLMRLQVNSRLAAAAVLINA